MLSIKLENFEGPLDLLLHLIDRNKVNIYDIPIAQITDQYLEAISGMDTQDLDMASDFLLMAATLLDIKSRMLLPAEVTEEGEEIDPREELVNRLIEYKVYKNLSEGLAGRSAEASKLFFREEMLPPEVRRYEPPVVLEELLGDVSLQKLQDIFERFMRRQIDRIDPVRSHFGNIERESVKMADKLDMIMQLGRKQKRFSFRMLMNRQKNRPELVVTFLACLEMIHRGIVTVKQETTFGEIELEWNDRQEVEFTNEELEQYD